MNLDSNLVALFDRFSFSGGLVQEIQDVEMMDRKVSGCNAVSPLDKSRNLYFEKKRLSYFLYLISSILGEKSSDSSLQSPVL